MTDTPDPPPVAPPRSDSYAMVAQSCAMAIQDAVGYLRNVEIVANATIGVAQERLLSGVAGPDPAKAIATAQEAVVAAIGNLETVSAAIGKVLKDFPRD